MTEEELYAGAGEVTRKCLDDILESEYGFVQDDEETYTSEYLLTYPCKTFAEGLTDTLLQYGFSGQADDAKEKIAYVRECCKQRRSIRKSSKAGSAELVPTAANAAGTVCSGSVLLWD